MRGSHIPKLHRTEKKINIGMDLANLTKNCPSLKSKLQFKSNTSIYWFNHERDIQNLPYKRVAEICLYTKQSPYSILQIISTNIMSLKPCPEAVGITEESLGVFSDKLNYSPLLSQV